MTVKGTDIKLVREILSLHAKAIAMTSKFSEGGGLLSFSCGKSYCKLDIKTQIAFRQVTRCQKILGSCCEETTIPICF